MMALPESDAEELVARIRQKMEKDRQELGNNAVSLSLGMATVANVAELSEALMLADKRMYEDKAKRR